MFVFVLPLVFSHSLWAAGIGKSIDIVDPSWGKFTIRVEDAGQPREAPLRVDLTLLCSDQTGQADSAKPQAQALVDHSPVCAFEKYAFDRDKKILTLQFTTPASAGEEAKCEKHEAKNFEMKKLCASWSARNRKKK